MDSSNVIFGVCTFCSCSFRLYLNKDSTYILTTDWRDKLSDDEKMIIGKLTARLQDSMNTFTTDGFAFVKTSSRSAKDAPMVQGRFKDLYLSELQSYPQEERSENLQISCLLKAAFEALKVKTAEQVIDMFIRSERIYQDLLLAAVNQVEMYNEHFVIRKFVHIDIDMEFRGFVQGHDLVALSQYNYLIYSKRLVEEKEKYGKMVKDYYNQKIRPKLENTGFPENSIIDFAVCNNGKYFFISNYRQYISIYNRK